MFKQFLAILLSCLMLTANMGVVYTMHYCGGKEVKSSFGLGHASLSCGTAKINEGSCTKENHKDLLKKEGCCGNKFISLSNVSNYQIPCVFQNHNPDFKFLFIIVDSFANRNATIQEFKQFHRAYVPPAIKQDRSILFQVFRV